jgi:NAD(P)-dependent dehydrogenase (short-subunit alcohol dehydrogenase family)
MNSIHVDLDGKVVAVTGASGALGSAVVRTLRDCNAVVAQIDHAPVPAGNAEPLRFGGYDLAETPAAAAALAQVAAKAGKIDALINIAGGFQFQKLEAGSLEHWDNMYRQNLRSAVACCAAALPFLVKSGAGRIINLGAAGAEHAGAGMGAYAAAKAGVAKLTESLAQELKDRGGTVNAILPSIMDTPRNRLDMPEADFTRWVPLESVAKLMAYLLSDAAAAITGALIPIKGRV